MSEPDVIAEALKKAGGVKAVATALGMSEEGVRLWRSRGKVPPEHVIWLAERTGWEHTPNQLAGDLYPHPDDGLPVERRAAAQESAA